MKVIVAGSRSISEYETVEKAILSSNFEITEIVSGTARGVDQSGEYFGVTNNIAVKRFPADWKKYNKGAGPIRNKQMADYADALIAVWDGKSRGTKNMIETMKKMDKEVYVFNTT